MGRQELLQPCCSSRCAWSVPMGHDAVLTPLGVCDGDRWGQSLLGAFPTSQPSELCSPRMRNFVMSPSSNWFRSVSARTMPWEGRGEEGRGFKAHFGCQCLEQRTPNWVGVTLGLPGEAWQDVLTPLWSMLLELRANPNSSMRAGEKGMTAELQPRDFSSGCVQAHGDTQEQPPVFKQC